MNRIVSIFVCFLFIFSVQAQENKAIKRPKLVVGIVVDQMRWDYLYRFYDHYTEGGFKRLMKDGFNCQNTFINYVPSYTGPGHACIYTGSVPAIHGIVSNDWIDNATGKTVYCVEDNTPRYAIFGAKVGQMSARNLLTTTVGDELSLVTNKHSRIFGIALKDRGAVLPAGHTGDASWFEDSTGEFTSNAYWIPIDGPARHWLDEFNSKHYADSLIKQEWDLLYNDIYNWNTETDKDDVYEGHLPGEKQSLFNHNRKGTETKGYNKLRYLPGGNTIVFKAARSCIKSESLGHYNNTDMLCLSFSTTDYVGHTFGPNSIEVQDIYYRFDAELASFLRFLDKEVGEGNYTIFLTADHGAAHNTEFLKNNNIPAGNKSEKEANKELAEYLKKATGKDSLLRAVTDYQIYLNEPKFTSVQQREDVKKLIVDWFYKQDGVAYAVDMENMSYANVPEPIKTMIVNGYNKQRSGCIQVILQPGWYSDSHKTGITHGTWNPYDTHIPLLWYGWGIPKGETHRKVNMTDIAATLSALLHIQMPNGCTGSVITEIVE